MKLSQDQYDVFMARWIAFLWGVFLSAAAFGCVTRAQVCVEAQHARTPSDDWRRSNNLGASVCVDVEKQ